PKEIVVTPFGIDIEKFYPKKVKRIFGENDIVIGTVKSLEIKYGIENLINAFSILKQKYPVKPLKLFIVGKGTQELFLKPQVKKMKCSPAESENYCFTNAGRNGCPSFECMNTLSVDTVLKKVLEFLVENRIEKFN